MRCLSTGTVAGIVAATVLGVLVGLGRLSRNALASALCRGYVEVMRNVPLLLHIFLWYGLLLELLVDSRHVADALADGIFGKDGGGRGARAVFRRHDHRAPRGIGQDVLVEPHFAGEVLLRPR